MILTKNEIRSIYREKRNLVSNDRNNEIRPTLLEQILPHIEPYKTVLSYIPIHNEIDLSPLNTYLKQRHKLLLPKIDQNILVPILANDNYETGPFRIVQPIGEPFTTPDCVLVPGIAFDEANHRLGYGKGFYDRFLQQLPKECTKIGIGFKEQKTPFLLPVEPHDIPLDLILLF